MNINKEKMSYKSIDGFENYIIYEGFLFKICLKFGRFDNERTRMACFLCHVKHFDLRNFSISFKVTVVWAVFQK